MTVRLDIPNGSGTTTLEAGPQKPLFVIGQNGTGKSALVHRIVALLGGRAVYIPGSRPNHFDQEGLSITTASRRALTEHLWNWDSQPDGRWRVVPGTSRNEKAIHDLTTAEIQFAITAAGEIKAEGRASKAIDRLQEGDSPLDKVNSLLAQANLPIRAKVENGELKANRDGTTISIARMSDGEKAALILISDVVAAPAEAVFVIDEPELHLHRSIVVPLVNALMRERPNNTFIISTHELELPAENVTGAVAMVRGSHWQANEIQSWDLDVITDESAVPEDLRVSLLGSRRKILFIEGDDTSLDRPLYALLFPSASVSSRASCREVERCVTGLRATEGSHHAKAFGLIDNDGMTREQVATFEAKGIYPLPVHTVESLYYSREVLLAIAALQGENLGIPPATLLADAKAKGLEELAKNDRINHFGGRMAERRLRDQLLQQLPTRTTLVRENASEISVTIPSPLPAEIARLQELQSAGDLDEVIAHYPIRESGMLDAMAKALRYQGRADYERAVLSRIKADDALRNLLKAKLGYLAEELG